MLQTSARNQSVCQVCGGAPEDKYTRNRAARVSGYRYSKTRSNRVRVGWMPERMRSRFGAWQGQLVCVECYQKFSKELNL